MYCSIRLCSCRRLALLLLLPLLRTAAVSTAGPDVVHLSLFCPDCRLPLVSPHAASLSIMLLPSNFSLLLLLMMLLSLLRGQFFFLPLQVVVSDTDIRCCSTAAILPCRCCGDPSIFHHSFRWDHPALTCRFSDASLTLRQHPDCSGILAFFRWPFFCSRLY